MKRVLNDARIEHSPKPKAVLKRHKTKSDSSASPTGSVSSSVYRLREIVFGKLTKRYKRFLADVVLDASGETVTAHCPNTGPLLGLLEEPSPPVLLTKSADPKRKCPYTLQAIQHTADPEPVWIGVHSALANKIVGQMLEAKMIPQLADFDEIRSEAVYGKDKKSRADFLLSTSDSDRKMYVEVKAITYSETRGDVQIGLFPDSKSTRAQKHLRELMDVMERGTEAACVFVVMGNPCTAVGPFKEKDPKFAELMKDAYIKGVAMIGVGLELDLAQEDGCDFVFKRFLDVDIDP